MKIHAVFQNLKRAYPGLPDRAKPIGMGYHGIVVDNRDGTILKAYMRHTTTHNLRWDRRALRIEELTLRLLKGQDLHGVAVPRLVEPAHVFESGARGKPFLGIVRMTKLPGGSMRWADLCGTATAKEQEFHFRQAGEVMGRFQKASVHFPKTPYIDGQKDWAATILTSDRFEDPVNTRLSVLQDAFSRAVTPAIIHGDVHGGNLLTDGHFNVTGLLDYAPANYNLNHLQEFRFARAFADHMPHIIRGFESVTGQTINREALALTGIADITHRLRWCGNKPGMQTAWDRHYAELKAMLAAAP